jgi:hypothetical protein
LLLDQLPFCFSLNFHSFIKPTPVLHICDGLSQVVLLLFQLSQLHLVVVAVISLLEGLLLGALDRHEGNLILLLEVHYEFVLSSDHPVVVLDVVDLVIYLAVEFILSLE